MDRSQAATSLEAQEDGRTPDQQVHSGSDEIGGEQQTGEFLLGKRDTGVLRIGFPAASDCREKGSEPAPWSQFLDNFDDAGLTFLYRNNALDGHHGRFFRFFLS